MTLGAVLIVKNEAQTIERCLASARAAGVTVFTIVDTGSTDTTWEILERQPDVNYGLLPWVNFGHNRSEAFALARGTADWLLALDSDMTVEIDPGWEPDPSVDAYMLEMGTGDFSYRLPLLLKGDQEWKSYGAVHEYTARADGSLGKREPTDAVRITHHGEGRSSPEKSRWHLDLLEAEMAAEPWNPRPVFYAAQTARELSETEKARQLYVLRVSMGGWDEEVAVAARWAAVLEPEWPERCAGLIAAWEMRPSRLEPLCDLLRELNSRGHHQTAYRLSTGLVAASQDVLFVDRSVEWQVPFERSIAAWWTGHYDEFLRLSMALLENPRLPDPERAAVIANLALKAA